MINGVPVKLTNEKGETETAVFATIRREPKLRDCILAEQEASLSVMAAARTLREAVTRMDTCPTAEFASARAAASQASITLADAQQQSADAARAFLVTGFQGAGYTPDDAERLVGLVPPERLGELVERCRIGAGRLDFS